MDEQVSGGPIMAEERPMVNRIIGDYDLKSDYKPNKQQILRDYEINIRFLSVGCVVRVGCKEIPFRNVGEAMEEINRYVNKPYEEGQRWNKLFDSVE